MTKRKAIKLAVIAMLVCALWGCSKEDTGKDTENQTTQKQQEKEYIYLHGEQKIAMGDDVEAAVKILGEDYEYFEAPSCAVDGMDMFYYYQNVTLVVNEIDGKKIVTGLWLLNDAVGTPEGIRIHSAYEDVIATYGSQYEMKGTVLIYSGNNVELSIGITEGKVTTLEYVYR